jgi:MarR family transcriptional regulator, lower aerobic nicotinate degradation pathway regulator
VTNRPVRKPVSGASKERLTTVDALAQLSFTVHGTLERRAAQHELSVVQMRLLGILRDRTPTMNELAKMLLLDKSSVTGLVDRAERRGLVMRVPSTEDRRAVKVRLTGVGRALGAQVAGSFEKDVSLMLDCLTAPERQELSGIVSRVLVESAARYGIDLFANVTDMESSG